MPESTDVTRTRGRLWTPIAKSCPVKSRSETCPRTRADIVRQARMPIPPACRATVAPTLPMARTMPGGLFMIIISILVKSASNRAAGTHREEEPQPVVGYGAAAAAATGGGVSGKRTDPGLRGFVGSGVERRSPPGVRGRAHAVAVAEGAARRLRGADDAGPVRGGRAGPHPGRGPRAERRPGRLGDHHVVGEAAVRLARRALVGY